MSYRFLRYFGKLPLRKGHLHQISNTCLKTDSFNIVSLNFTQNIKNYTTKLKSNQKQKSINEYFEQLKLENIKIGFLNYETLLSTLEQLEQNNFSVLSEEQSLFLFQSCSRNLPTEKSAEKLRIFNKIWYHLAENNLITSKHILEMIEIFRCNKISFEDFEKFIEKYGIEKNEKLYEGLIQIACEHGNIKKSTEILSEMHEKQFPITVNIFNSLILGHSRQGDLKNSEYILETMNAANLQPTGETFTQLICSYLQNNLPEKAEEILKEKSNLLKEKHILQIVHEAALKRKNFIIISALKLLPTELLTLTDIPINFRKLCTELIYNDLIDEAFLIVKSFPIPKFSENQDIDTFGQFLIKEYIKSGQNINDTIKICKELIESERNTRAIHIACEIALRRTPDKAFGYLQALSELEKLRPHYFWPLLLYNFHENGEYGILETIKQMTKLNIDFDFETLSFYILPRLSITLTDGKKGIKLLEKCGMKTSEIMTPIISYLILQQKFDEIIKIIEMYPTKLDTEQFVYPLANIANNMKLTKSIQKIGYILRILQRKSQNSSFDLSGQFLLEIITNPKLKNDYQNLNNLIQEMKLNGIKISSIAAEVLSGHLKKINNEQFVGILKTSLQEMIDKSLNLPSAELFGAHIAHPRDMTLEELECHLIELESKSLNTRGVLRRLLQLCVRENKLERALEIKEKCDKLKVQVSPGMMASVFDMYIKLRNVELAENCFTEIKKLYPGFLLDEHKIIDYAALLIENNRQEDAKRVLKERSNISKIKGGEYIVKNVWQLLSNVAANSKSDKGLNETREFLNFLQKSGYCTYHNTLLGPVIREYIIHNNIKAAVTEYKGIVDKYKKTPLQLELMTILIGLSNNINTDKYNITSLEAKTLLQDVITYSSKIHGNSNTNVPFILAVAEAGTENQLRKLLIDPKISLNQDLLIKNCEHLSLSGKISTLLKLAKACRGLGHSVKEQDLYNVLLNNFVKDNNYTSAMELFEKLEADDEFKISQEFIKILVNLCKANNMEIPNNLALRAQIL